MSFDFIRDFERMHTKHATVDKYPQPLKNRAFVELCWRIVRYFFLPLFICGLMGCILVPFINFAQNKNGVSVIYSIKYIGSRKKYYDRKISIGNKSLLEGYLVYGPSLLNQNEKSAIFYPVQKAHHQTYKDFPLGTPYPEAYPINNEGNNNENKNRDNKDNKDKKDQQSSGVITPTITDPQNLLGAHFSQISTELNKLKKETGVTLRLIYLPSFDTKKPALWAKEVLESAHPSPNTVLLAVASQEGQLVVVVSSNSDEWLKKQSTVEELSKIAVKPITQVSTPNWSESVIALSQQIITAYKEHLFYPWKVAIITISSIVGVGIIATIGLFVGVYHRGKRIKPGKYSKIPS